MKWKYVWVILITIAGIGMTVWFLYMIVGFSPGTLGATAEPDLNCSESDVEYRIDDLLKISPYKVKDKDTSTLIWWSAGGYDFLNYRCINIRKRLYMITIYSDGSAASNESSISVRAYYDRNKTSWIYAKEFTSTDNYRAEIAMKYLTHEMSTCL